MSPSLSHVQTRQPASQSYRGGIIVSTSLEQLGHICFSLHDIDLYATHVVQVKGVGPTSWEAPSQPFDEKAYGQ